MGGACQQALRSGPGVWGGGSSCVMNSRVFGVHLRESICSAGVLGGMWAESSRLKNSLLLRPSAFIRTRLGCPATCHNNAFHVFVASVYNTDVFFLV